VAGNAVILSPEGAKDLLHLDLLLWRADSSPLRGSE
jgi:hypothetical protein